MKSAFFSLINDNYPGFEYKDKIKQNELRQYLFALIAENIQSFLSENFQIIDKIKGLLLVPGDSCITENITDNLKILYFTPSMKESLFQIAAMHIDLLNRNMKLKSDYELLKIESERAAVQYRRLQNFYESVQVKARKDIQHQNKWTISALLKLIGFRNNALAKCSIGSFPDTILSFLSDEYFDFRGIALLKYNKGFPEIIKSAGDIKSAFDEISSGEDEIRWALTLPFSIEDQCDSLLLAAKSRDYNFREYERSFFLLLYEIVSSAHKEKLNELELVHARDEAESANRMKSQFIANMNHELRNPLNGIIGMISLLKSSDVNSGQKQQIDLLEYSALTLLNIINDLLDFSSIEKGVFRLHNDAFYPEDILGKSIALFDMPARNKGLKLKFVNKCEQPCQVEGDSSRLQQIIINFISNSIKYSEHGEITVTQDIAMESGSEINYKFTVSDQGIGIPEDKLETIFNEFFQIEDTYTKSHQGLGLGLAIVKSLVHLMKGFINVKSTPGKGSTFSITIPFRRIKPGAEKSAPSIEDLPVISEKIADKDKVRILIAEDDIVSQLFLEMTFKRLGYSIDKAANGKEVLNYLELASYDMIFMDIGMPEMNGLECISRIRHRDIAIPAVAISGYTSAEDVERFKRAGFNHVLSKPVDINKLMRIIESESQAVL